MNRRITGAAVVLAVGLVSACTGSTHASTSPNHGDSYTAASAPPATKIKPGGSVTIVNVSGASWTCHFNPFNPAVSSQSIGFSYEPLVFVDALQNAKTTPMLASSFAWSDGDKTIDFAIRTGVKWSDGTPFTAQDVVFTFQLMKKYPDLDLYGLWGSDGAGLQSVTAKGNHVTMNFSRPAQVNFYHFAGQVMIVPQHLWSTGDAAKDPVKFTDPHPVGTGPFTVSKCTSTNVSYAANKTYWMPNEPHIQTVQYPAYLDNGPANRDLANGSGQWGGQYIPNIDASYVSTDRANNHYYFAPTANVDIVPNLAKGLTSKLAFRQAIAYAIDRDQLSKIGETGYEPPANQAGIVTPTFDKYLDSGALKSAGYDKQNVAKAKQLITGLGYSTSHPAKVSIITPGGFTDWDATLAVLKQQLKPIGIDLQVEDLEQQTYQDRLNKGDFELGYKNHSAGPTPYQEMQLWLASDGTAPLGQVSGPNYERYKNPAVDQLFAQFASAQPAEQVAIMKKIEGYMIKDVPVIPTVEMVDWYQFNTKDLAGWPTQNNLYAQPAPWAIPDEEQVLLHLYSKSAQ